MNANPWIPILILLMFSFSSSNKLDIEKYNKYYKYYRYGAE